MFKSPFLKQFQTHYPVMPFRSNDMPAYENVYS